MKGISNIINIPIAFISKYEHKFVNVFFLFFIVSFFIDRILFYFFINFPFFVVSAILVFPFLFLATQKNNPDKRQLYVLIFSFLIITILNSIVYLFGAQNISDFLFIVLFITIYFYYKENIKNLTVSNVYVFLIISLFLFSFTFFNIDSDSSSKSNTKYNSLFSKDISYIKKSPSIKNITQEQPDIKKESNNVDKFKPFNERHTGLFRRTHIASYFFGFLFLFFSYQYQKNKGVLNAILLLISLAFCFYTGIRSMPTAFIISIFLFLFRRKYILYLAMLIAVLVFLIITNEYFLQLTKSTIFYQYFYIIHTITDNFTSLARFKLYHSWWMEVSEFGFWEFMIGKSYMNALIANGRNYGNGIWFHNDFLNIFYTYGIGGAMLYIWFFIKIYRDNKIYIKQNLFIFVFYSSMVITAFINGFYYYFPIFLLYIFFMMIKIEKKLIQ